MNVFALGASQNIGYHAAVRLLSTSLRTTPRRSHWVLTMCARKRRNSHVPPPHPRRARVRRGHRAVHRFWTRAARPRRRAQRGRRRARVGGRAGRGARRARRRRGVLHRCARSITPLSLHRPLTKLTSGGALHISPFFVGTISPPNLCTLALLHLLRTLPPSLRSPTAQPKFVVLSTTGATAASHAALPAPVKLFYWWLLAQPHADKRAAERVFARVAGLAWDPRDVVGEGVLPRGWEDLEGMPGEGEIRKVVVVRPAFLTDGPETGRVRAQVEGEAGGEGWTVGRRDVARFVVEEVVGDWEKWEGRRVSVAY